MNCVWGLFNSSLKSRKGTGKISASGGSGLAGGGGGRVSIAVFSWHDDPRVFVHGKLWLSIFEY